jgi:uncharacterized RDD family membrane protein YckC
MSITPITGWDGSLGGYAAEQSGLVGVSFWPRAAARLIDLVVHFAVRYGTGYLFGLMLLVASGGHVPRLIIFKLRHPGLTGFAFTLLGAVAYHVIFTAVHGSTLGKRVLSMVVVQEDGSPCGLKSAVVRELGYFVDTLFFGIIGYMAMQESVQEQRHGDNWAHTVVCKRELIAPDKLRGAGRFAVASMFALMADAAFIMVGLLLIIAG